MSATVAELLRGSPYQGYAYSYPHKHAYRALAEPRSLTDVWKTEKKDALFLYLHIPFCEMRCGFCNLFTQSHSRAGLKYESEQTYLDALEREVGAIRSALTDARFSRGAIGGGTPTFLSHDGLRRLLTLFQLMTRTNLPMSVETSPFTATTEKLALLREFGVTRVSIGVQSFIDAEVRSSGRAQSRMEVEQALQNIRTACVPELNIDLIYGLPTQTEQSWLHSLRSALQWRPEELYLYPLYVRPLTGLACKEGMDGDENWDSLRRTCYQAGRDFLLGNGYIQYSMRHFRRLDAPSDAGDYCCQRDGMVGVGCGARSYTRDLHYSSEYAVGRSGITEIVSEYIQRSATDFGRVRYGFELDSDEQRRRMLIKSLLHRDGLDRAAYRDSFQSDVFTDMPGLNELLIEGLAKSTEQRVQLTPLGMEFSDVIGPWLASARVRQSMSCFALR